MTPTAKSLVLDLLATVRRGTVPVRALVRAGELFGWVRSGTVRLRIGLELPLAEAAEAHRRLEGRRTTGKVLLIP